jgi:hypothetical protein
MDACAAAIAADAARIRAGHTLKLCVVNHKSLDIKGYCMDIKGYHLDM